MIADCPDLKEVSDFHFLQLRTLRLTKENEVPRKSLNIITSASKYGLLFVGVEGGLKVLKLEDILNVDDDKENRSIEENYSFTFVQSHTPALLALSASQKTLALCIESTSGVIVSFYDVSTFAHEGANWQPYATTSPKFNTGFLDFIWNPATEGLYAYCLSDGSLHIEELSGIVLKPIASLPNADVTSVCWSPKGKQLVAGRGNGTFAQFKPTLQEVKSVAPPPLEDSPIKVSSICWISNTLFAVVYVAADAPNLLMVSTPKDSPVIYTNFYDVCLGNNSMPDQKYFLHLEPQWGILVCASVDSIEIAVLGDMPNWVQWDPKEDGKALLPCKDGATHPIGVTVMYSAMRTIVISESESYPPMPVIFFMTNNGLLVSFHMINSKAEATSLVSAPLMLESKKNAENSFVTNEPGRMVLKRSSSSSVQPSDSTFAVAPAPSVVNSNFAMGSVQSPLSATFNVGNKQAIPDQLSMLQNARSQATSITPAFGINANSTYSQSDLVNSTSNSLENEKPSPILSRPWEGTHVPQANREKIQVATTPLPSTIEKKNEVQSSRDSSYMTAILTEIQSFTKELQDLKLLQSTAPCLDSEEDMAALKVFALNLHNFQKDVSETMQSLSSDIFTLKNVLLESFVMVEEACSRLRRKNDHSYIMMLKERALDPITAKRMQKVHQHYQYLSTQLQEVNDKLDQDWINLLSKEKKSAKNNPNISSTEAIYKTIVNNQKIIHNLRKTVDMVSKKCDEKKLRGISKSGNWAGYHKRSTQEDLSKLADEFLQVQIGYQEEKEPLMPKRFSSESQNFLRQYLKGANMVTVRPTAVYSPSQSRLLSNAITMAPGDSAASDLQKQDESPQQVTVLSTPVKDNTLPVSPFPETQRPKTPTKLSLTFQNAKNVSTVLSCAPVYEPITPPESFPAEPINKTLPSNNTAGNSILKDKNNVMSAFKSGITVASTPDVSIFKQKDTKIQGPSTNLFSMSKNMVDSPPNVSLSVGGKIPAQNFVENVPPAPPSSLMFPKTPPFTSNAPKNMENASLKFASGVNNTPFSFTFKNFQQTFTEQNKASEQSVQKPLALDLKVVSGTPITPVSVQESKIAVTSESSVFHQSEMPLAPKSNSFSNLSFGQSSLFSTPATKSPVFPPVSAPENKNLPVLSEVSSSSTRVKCSTGFKSSAASYGDITNVSFTDKGEISANLTAIEGENSIYAGSHDKIIVVDTKSPSSLQVFNVETSEQKFEAVKTSSIENSSLNQLTISPIQKTDSSVVTSSQGSGSISFGDLSVIKQTILSTQSNVPSQIPAITSVSSVNVSSAEMNNVPPPTTVAIATTVSSTSSVISSASVVSQPENSAPKTSPTVLSTFFTQTTTSTPSPPLFGQSTAVTSSVSDAAVVPPAKSDSSAPMPSFSFKSTFGQTGTGASSMFGSAKPEGNSAFGQATVTQSGTFGQFQVASSGFGGTSGGFFSQPSSFGASNVTAGADPNNQSSAISFGKFTFGQQTSGSFGLAKSLLGQSTTTSFPQPASPSSSFSFGQTSNNNNANVFGQGAFFSGLGGKPSEENSNKNVFGMSSGIKPSSESNLFGNSGPGSFVNKGSSFSGGSFSSGGGSVAQSGFGSFQQNLPQKPGGFGAAPAFGGAPAFGSPPAFGSAPSFGSGNALSSVFGQQQQQQQPQANFSNFASASTPTFGALASQTSGFVSPPPTMAGGGGFGTQGNTFGGTSSPFAGSTFGGQSPGFGSPSSPPASSSAFTQWRN